MLYLRKINYFAQDMRPSNMVFPAVWEIENDPALHKKYRLDFFRVRDGDFQRMRDKALLHDIEGILQLVVWSRRNVKQSDVLAWIPFFERLDLRDNELSQFYLKGYIANHLSDILRNRKFKEKELAQIAHSPVLRNWILFSFVDYETLQPQKYYGRLITELNPENLEEETFKKSLILTQYYLEGNVDMMKKWSESLSRYPTDESYFPIINGRVWAARFLNQMLKTGQLQSDLVKDWFLDLQETSLSLVMPKSLEVLPILVRYGADMRQIQDVLDYVGYAVHLNVIQNPLVASIDNAVYLASRTAFFARINDDMRAQEYRLELYKNLCLPSYSNYLFGIANAF